MKLTSVTASVSFILSVVSIAGKVYFQEDFGDKDWQQRWTVPSKWKPSSEIGAWKLTAGKWHGDNENQGLQTSENSKFYGLIAPLDESFSQTGDLVLQFTVKHENKLDCGGAYVKLLGGDVDKDSFGGETPYEVMFGPDICGVTARTHVIFHNSATDENLLVKDNITVERDQLTHVYTLHVNSDGEYEVYIDQSSVKKGKLEDDFDFLQPRTIPDPAQSKPADWVEERRIPDPSETKPEGYDDTPQYLPDPDAVKPDVWDDDEDGVWEPVSVPNPDYKGPWIPRMIDNPDYKGEWVHPTVANPDFKEDPDLSKRCKNCTHIGFELWQVTAGSIFDDIIVTDSLEEAHKLAEKSWAASKDDEKTMYEEVKKKESEDRTAQAQAAADAAAKSEPAPATGIDPSELDLDWSKDEL